MSRSEVTGTSPHANRLRRAFPSPGAPSGYFRVGGHVRRPTSHAQTAWPGRALSRALESRPATPKLGQIGPGFLLRSPLNCGPHSVFCHLEKGWPPPHLFPMITKTSLRVTGVVVAGAITFAAVSTNLAHKSVYPLADYPLDAFVLQAGSTATSAGIATAITVQHAITGDIISAPPPAQEHYIGLMIPGGKNRNSA